MERRRFLALAATTALLAAGCGRWLGERTDDGPAGDAAPERSDVGPGRDDVDNGDDNGSGDADGDRTQPDDHDTPDADSDPTDDEPESQAEQDTGPPDDLDEHELDPDLLDAQPQEWGERVTGVRTRLDTDEPVIALTFDACGGSGGNGYDAQLIEQLRAAAVPATLFLNARWLEANRATARQLADDELFELANHGTEHRPISVTGRTAYGISGTTSAQAVVDEVLGCQRLLTALDGAPPRHFRAGTAYGDEVAVAIVRDLGLEVVNFDVLGDAGATFSATEVERALLGARSGSIALLHMNHPGSGTAAGVAAAIPQLRDRGFSFTTLGDHRLA